MGTRCLTSVRHRPGPLTNKNAPAQATERGIQFPGERSCSCAGPCSAVLQSLHVCTLNDDQRSSVISTVPHRASRPKSTCRQSLLPHESAAQWEGSFSGAGLVSFDIVMAVIGILAAIGGLWILIRLHLSSRRSDEVCRWVGAGADRELRAADLRAHHHVIAPRSFRAAGHLHGANADRRHAPRALPARPPRGRA